MVKSWKNARKGVMWKRNTQLFDINYSLQIQMLLIRLRKETWKSPGFHRFTIRERGKTRHIMSVRPEEKVVQKCLCDYCITPIFDRIFIHDNAATRKGKGHHFAVKRTRKMLARHMRKHGTQGWILLFDFHDYFGTIRHDIIKGLVWKHIRDPRLVRLLCHLIDCFGTRGLGLGSQISQNLALLMSDRIDHRITEMIRPEAYVRYMDDGWAIDVSREKLERCLRTIRMIADRNSLEINEKKTMIVPIKRGFEFIKKRFRINGRMVMKISKQSIVHARRKMKKLVSQAQNNRMSWKTVYDSFQSWRAYAEFGNAHRTIRNMEKLYTELVFERRTTWLLGNIT